MGWYGNKFYTVWYGMEGVVGCIGMVVRRDGKGRCDKDGGRMGVIGDHGITTWNCMVTYFTMVLPYHSIPHHLLPRKALEILTCETSLKKMGRITRYACQTCRKLHFVKEDKALGSRLDRVTSSKARTRRDTAICDVTDTT